MNVTRMSRRDNIHFSAQESLTLHAGFPSMSRFEDTSIMRARLNSTLIELRKPEIGPQSKARGILIGALLGVLAWFAIIAVFVEVRRWMR